MSFKKYRGPLDTVEHAMMAHAVITIECRRCTYYASEYAWKLYNRSKEARALPLYKPIRAFACRQCGSGAEAVIVLGCSGGRFTRPDPNPLGLRTTLPACRRCGEPSAAATEDGFGGLYYWCDGHIPAGHEGATYFHDC